MKHLVIKNLLLSLLIFLFQCSKKPCEIECRIDKTEWTELDMGPFTLDVPLDFSYKPKEGVDSYVGEISNDITKFIFDYGYYSEIGPRTYLDQWIEKPIPYTRIIYDFADKFEIDTYSSGVYWMEQISLRSISTDINNEDFIYQVTAEYMGQTQSMQYSFQDIDNSYEGIALQHKVIYTYNAIDSFFHKFYYPKRESGSIGYYSIQMRRVKPKIKLSVKTSLDNETGNSCCVAKEILRTIKMK